MEKTISECTKWFTEEERLQLIGNGRLSQTDEAVDHVPMVRLFAPDGPQSWLVGEIDPDLPDFAYGLCDLGIGCPESRVIHLPDLIAHRGPAGLEVVRDIVYRPLGGMTMSRLERMSSQAGRIIV